MAQLSDVIRSGIRAEDLTGMSPDQQKAIEPLLRFVNTGIQGLAAVLSAQVSTDNLRTEVQTVPLSHGVAQLVSLKKLSSAKGIRALSVGSADGKTRHALATPLDLQGTTVPNQVKVTAYFMDSTALAGAGDLRAHTGRQLLRDPGEYRNVDRPDADQRLRQLRRSVPRRRIHEGRAGFVHLRGLIANAGAEADGVVAFVLPAGYRPSATVRASAANGSYVDIDSSGNVAIRPATGAGSNRALDAITFDTR
jgi:hypothetical protein